jgi:hypothetical protein
MLVESWRGKQPRLPMNQTNESSCQAGSHQGRTGVSSATTSDTHKPAPLLANPHESTPSSRSW